MLNELFSPCTFRPEQIYQRLVIYAEILLGGSHIKTWEFTLQQHTAKFKF